MTLSILSIIINLNKMMKALFLILAIMLFSANSIRVNHKFTDADYQAWALAAAMSDRRLKTNIEFLFKSPSGINVYSFKYIDDSSTTYQGVMAQELLGTEFEGAVIHGERYMAVNYGLIDVAFKKIDNLVSA